MPVADGISTSVEPTTDHLIGNSNSSLSIYPKKISVKQAKNCPYQLQNKLKKQT